ncbi:WD40 repeat-like protein [Gonapodya prolifera JEL478]|uniref:WD40 repeat-like protein n=1 Tax=Gonapodya prolifera (strain JEL478) TaxID=1344416 RepID=A0A139A2Y7_GONPJ|nr:WD40 repeat-like protein [Gonapodya prolifera JEL478]|eukprot:KXS10885.1 WD40 repeat-like protein [Gonapodya prolifera JEL478]
MNLPLLNPFESAIPEILTHSLHSLNATKCAFNRRGNYIAVGADDGKLEVWDLDTHTCMRTMVGHVGKITAISWSRDGYHVLTAATDWNCIYWDLVEGINLCTIRFQSVVNTAQMNPRDNFSFIACPNGEAPVLVTLKPDDHSPRLRPTITPIPLGIADETSRTTFDIVYVATFDHEGKHVALGSSKGMVTVMEYPSWKILDAQRPVGAVQIRSICYNRRGTDLCLNASDKIIRVCPILESGAPDWEEHVRFRDDIDRGQWAGCRISNDGDYVIGGNAAKHQLFIWYRIPDPDGEVVTLVSKLDGNYSTGGLVDFDMHPYRPIIASVAKQDKVLIWEPNSPENWSAFRPDFTEVSENKEYQEQEDEFDWISLEEIARRKALKTTRDHEDIDIVRRERANPHGIAYASDEEDLFDAYLPNTTTRAESP